MFPRNNRKTRRADAAEMRDRRKPSAAQKHLACPSRQNAITDGFIKLSNFYFAKLGLRIA